MNAKIKSRKNKIHPMGIAIAVLVIALFIAIGILRPGYYKTQNLLTIINSIPGRGILVLGFTFVLITGGIDLSVGYGMTLTIMILGVVLKAGASPVIACLAAIGTGLAIGIINGALIAVTKIPPFVVTLATMEACQGLVNILFVPNVKLKQDLFKTIGYGTVFGGFPVSAILLIVFFVIALLLLKNTKLGTYTFAIGSNKKNARLAGVNVKLYEAMAYVLSGLCMGLAGIVFCSRVATVQKTTGGQSVLMDVVTAAILGGNIGGGEGSVIGAIIGTILLQMLSSALVLFNVSGDGQNVIKGCLIIIGLIVMNILKKNQSSTVASK